MDRRCTFSNAVSMPDSLILVATDGSTAAKGAERAALDLAKATGDHILFVTVWRELRGDFGIPLSKLVPELADVPHEWAKETAAIAQSAAERAGVHAETEVRHGNPATEICAVATDRNPRMIVVGSHGWGILESMLLGSVTEGLVHHAPCPVLVVPGAEAD